MKDNPYYPPDSQLEKNTFKNGVISLDYDISYWDAYSYSMLHQFSMIAIQIGFILLCFFIFMTEISSDSVSLSNSSPIITAITWYFGLWLFQALFQLIILGG